MRNDTGTPKSLTEAIENGLDDGAAYLSPSQVEAIRMHVQDYLAQKFSIPIATEEHNEVMLRQLFLKCIKTKEVL